MVFFAVMWMIAEDMWLVTSSSKHKERWMIQVRIPAIQSYHSRRGGTHCTLYKSFWCYDKDLSHLWIFKCVFLIKSKKLRDGEF